MWVLISNWIIISCFIAVGNNYKFEKINTNEVNVAKTVAKTPAAQMYPSAINNPITAIANCNIEHSDVSKSLYSDSTYQQIIH